MFIKLNNRTAQVWILWLNYIIFRRFSFCQGVLGLILTELSRRMDRKRPTSSGVIRASGDKPRKELAELVKKRTSHSAVSFNDSSHLHVWNLLAEIITMKIMLFKLLLLILYYSRERRCNKQTNIKVELCFLAFINT